MKRRTGFSIALVASILFSGSTVGLGETGEPIGEKASGDGVLRAEMVVDTYSYKPDHLIVYAGVPVELTLKSVTVIVPHNFIIQAPDLGVEIRQEIPAGKTIQVQFTPTRIGKTEIYCDKKLLFFKNHKEKGMIGTLEVLQVEED